MQETRGLYSEFDNVNQSSLYQGQVSRPFYAADPEMSSSGYLSSHPQLGKRGRLDCSHFRSSSQPESSGDIAVAPPVTKRRRDANLKQVSVPSSLESSVQASSVCRSSFASTLGQSGSSVLHFDQNNLSEPSVYDDFNDDLDESLQLPEANSASSQERSENSNVVSVDSQATTSQATSSSSSVYEHDGFVSAAKRFRNSEARRLAELLEVLKRGRLSRRGIRRVLKTQCVSSGFSYEKLMSFIEARTRVKKRFLWTCSAGHATLPTIAPSSMTCPSARCALQVEGSARSRYWFVLPSELVQSLCLEESSFHEILEGSRRAKHAMLNPDDENLRDFYDGTMFKLKHGSRMETCDLSKELYIFLTLSSDGFEVFAGRRGGKTVWPVLFSILNYRPALRFCTFNAMVVSFIPGTHDPEYLDSFLRPIVDDLVMMENGIMMPCADGRTRLVRIFVYAVPTDWPAFCKAFGFSGHGAATCCRNCLKRAVCIGTSRHVYPVPTGSRIVRRDAIKKTNGNDWYEIECPHPRTNESIREVWKRNSELKSGTTRELKSALKRLIEESGIKCQTELSRLDMDASQAFSYDPMHQLLLGWVKHLIVLCTGRHKKDAERHSSYIVSSNTLKSIDWTLEHGGGAIPAHFGRRPEPLQYLSGYKAEDFRNFGLFYGPVLFSSGGDRQLKRIWNLTSRIVDIASNVAPRRSDIQALQQDLQAAHAMFTERFYVDNEHSFVFTPNTHALLHFANIMKSCGPLPNISQFFVERLIGELGSLVKSKTRPEANLFNEWQSLFALRMLKGGLEFPKSFSDDQEDNQVSEDEASLIVSSEDSPMVMLGRGEAIGGQERRKQALQYVESCLPLSADEVRVISLVGYQRAERRTGRSPMIVETLSHYQRRNKKTSGARQSCWVACAFWNEKHDSLDSGETCKESLQVYYGCINELWKIEATFRLTHEQLTVTKIFCTARIDWVMGLRRDVVSGTVFTKLDSSSRRGSIRQRSRTVEDSVVVQRSIGFLDFDGKRHFLDPEQHRLARQDGAVLMGFAV